MDTIAAISTATGNGGIGIIRMSGKETFSILKKIFVPVNKEEEIKGYTIKYGYIIDSKTKEIIDEVLVSFFISPNSYTKENVCEINSHGGSIVERKILEECLKNGANLAEPGEFTKRAFLNGRMDLSQAESVIDLINAKTEKEARASVKQLQGSLSNKIKEIRKQLLDIMADIEASIDYPEYDIEETTNEKIQQVMQEIRAKLDRLEKSFQTGKILKEGIKTAILGRPNAGKSSLLNAILKEERAIVSQIEGTTRDTIEEFINIQGIPLKIIDTAGIRKTEDEVEEIGVKKALKIAEESDLIIAIFDNSKDLKEEDYEILSLIKNKNAIILLNKIDIEEDKELEKEIQILDEKKKIIKISARTGQGLEELYDEIVKMFHINQIEIDQGEIITNIRHKNNIQLAKESIENVINQTTKKLPLDITAIYIKQILDDLGNITGENASEDIINEIFSKFCLGK